MHELPSDMQSTCTKQQMEHFISRVNTEKFENNPCITKYDWESFAQGYEDPNDIYERVEVESEPQKLTEFSRVQPTCKHRVLPTLLYMGQAHAGSTTIAALLDKIPGWSFGKVKEHRFFNQDEMHHSYLLYGAPYHQKSFSEYENEFEVSCDVHQTFDASIFYWFLGHNESTPSNGFKYNAESVKQLLGENVKMVFTIRDPVAYIRSNKFYGGNRGMVKKAESLFCDGMVNALQGWLKVFPRKNFLFLDFQENMKDLPKTISRIVDFAGMPPVDASTIHTNFAQGRRRSNHKKDDPHYDESYHKEHHSCKLKLQSLTGLTFSWGL